MLWIRIPILEIFIVPETAQRHHSSPTYYTFKCLVICTYYTFFFPTFSKTKFVVGDLWRSVQTWFISWPQLPVIRQAYRNLSPVVLAGPGTGGSSNSQQSKPLSSLAILDTFIKSNLPKTWHLLRWWVFAFMFQRTNVPKVECLWRQERSGGFDAGSAHWCLCVLSCPVCGSWAALMIQGSPAVLPVLAVILPAVLLWKDLVSFYLRLTLTRNWGATGKPGIVVNPVARLGIPA